MELSVDVYLSLSNVSRQIRSWMCDICLGGNMLGTTTLC
jgi:hypothetical protein